jgi:hypothetical protein
MSQYQQIILLPHAVLLEKSASQHLRAICEAKDKVSTWGKRGEEVEKRCHGTALYASSCRFLRIWVSVAESGSSEDVVTLMDRAKDQDLGGPE